MTLSNLCNLSDTSYIIIDYEKLIKAIKDNGYSLAGMGRAIKRSTDFIGGSLKRTNGKIKYIDYKNICALLNTSIDTFIIDYPNYEDKYEYDLTSSECVNFDGPALRKALDDFSIIPENAKTWPNITSLQTFLSRNYEKSMSYLQYSISTGRINKRFLEYVCTFINADYNKIVTDRPIKFTRTVVEPKEIPDIEPIIVKETVARTLNAELTTFKKKIILRYIKDMRDKLNQIESIMLE